MKEVLHFAHRCFHKSTEAASPAENGTDICFWSICTYFCFCFSFFFEYTLRFSLGFNLQKTFLCTTVKIVLRPLFHRHFWASCQQQISLITSLHSAVPEKLCVCWGGNKIILTVYKWKVPVLSNIVSRHKCWFNSVKLILFTLLYCG